MRSSKQYETYKDIWMKFLSNIVSEKIWLTCLVSFLLIKGLVTAGIWVAIVGGTYTMGKAIKAFWLKTQSSTDSSIDLEEDEPSGNTG